MNLEDIRVIILAGGKGTRLRPYTNVLPKPLVPVGDMPILEIVLRQLKYFGFRKVTLSVSHLANLIQTFFGDGCRLGLDITYCIEDRPMGTAGSIALVQDVSEHFLVMNGDLLTTVDYSALMSSHVTSGGTAMIAVFPREVKIDFGVLDLDSKGALVDYKEKPQLEFVVSMGINAFRKSVLAYIPKGEYLDIPVLMMNLKRAGQSVLTFRSECEWLDIGRPDDYERATQEFERSITRYLPDTR